MLSVTSASTARAKADDFDARAKAVDNKGAALLTEGLQQIVQYDRLPTSDGTFGEYVRFLCALPPREEHLPLIILLLQKKDPYLQEAGVNLATASIKGLNNYSGLEDPICALLKKPDLDGWVLYLSLIHISEPTRPY